jgi:uncharacterized protein with PQ loop repeat
MAHRTKLSERPIIAVIDRLMMIASIVHPITALPQVIQIYDSQNASGVSLLTWLGFMTIGLIFLSYGIVHRLKPLIINQVLWFIVDFLVVIGVVLYS